MNVERSGRAWYTSLLGPRASFHIAMGDDAPGPSIGAGKHATMEGARAGRHAVRRNRRRGEATVDEAGAAAPREQHES